MIEIIIIVYVDNLFIISVKKFLINDVKTLLKTEYKMKDLGNINHIIKIRVRKDRIFDMMTLNQLVYMNRFFKNYEMRDNYPVSTPINRYKFLTATAANETKTNQLEYLKRIKSLMYAMTSTRLDIAFVVVKPNQFNHDPYLRHQVVLD